MQLTQQYIAERVEVDDNGCWIWQKAKYKTGYGKLCLYDNTHPYGQRTLKASRASYEAFYGPTDLDVLHKCNVRACCNPKHLYAGTTLDNIADSFIAGTYTHGEKQGLSKLKDADIPNIRSSNLTMDQLASQYSVCQSTIWQVKNHVTWKHIP